MLINPCGFLKLMISNVITISKTNYPQIKANDILCLKTKLGHPDS